MKRILINSIAICLAVLTIGTAFAEFNAKPVDPKAWQETLKAEICETIVPEFRDSELYDRRYRDSIQLAKLYEPLCAFSQTLVKNAEKTRKAVLRYAKAVCPAQKSYSEEYHVQLDWKLLGALLFTFHEQITDVLRQDLTIETVTDAEANCTVTVAFADITEVLLPERETEWFAVKNTYYYLNTVYDDAGIERLPTGFYMPQEKLERLAFPLDAKWYTRIKTTWFRGRDKGTRRHTGMDIRCSHGSPVYACEGGIVNSVGYHVKGGYYVAVTDDDGYEYFYYHLKKDSQCVKRGQRVKTGEQLGLSGNTGNSAAPHLHLSVITPDKRFIDPFHVYYRWVYQKTGMLIKRPS